MKYMKEKYLIIGIVLLSIGFAAVTTILTINGTIKLGADADQFAKDVIFTDARTEEGGSATISNDGKTITYTSKILTTVDETTVLDFEISNKSKQYDAVASIECITDVESAFKNYIDVEPSATSYEIEASGKKDGYITTTLKKAYLIVSEEDIANVKITCTLNANAIGRESVATDDKDNNDGDTSQMDYRVGDEVEVDGQYIYVIKDAPSTENTVILLSAKNINTKTLTQSSGNNEISFSSSIYWTTQCVEYPNDVCDLKEITPPDAKNYAAYYAYLYGK